MQDKIKTPFSLLLVSIIFGCGPSVNTISQDKGAPNGPDQPAVEEQDKRDGQYLAVLSPLNLEFSGPITGAVTLAKEQDELIGDVRFSGGPASILHAQNVHLGPRCPTALDDLNFDGIIDAIEGQSVYGKILIPLDADLNYQRMGEGIFPVADQYGGYVYWGVASFERFIEDLKEEDLNKDDNIIKLQAYEKFNMEGLVVIIQGVPETTILPDTVMSDSLLSNYQTLPIACGVIKKVTSSPGVSVNDNSELPLPSGEILGGTRGGGINAPIPLPPRNGAESGPRSRTETGPEGMHDL